MTKEALDETTGSTSERYPNLKVSQLRAAKEAIDEAVKNHSLQKVPQTIRTAKLSEYTKQVVQQVLQSRSTGSRWVYPSIVEVSRSRS